MSADIQMLQPLLAWYDADHRTLPWRSQPTPYRVWVSEIMLQQTRVEAVLRYFERWMQALPTVHALASASESVYMKLWEGLGYYSRVRNLHRAADLVCKRFGEELPADYEALLSLPGIGTYTAGAICSIAFDIPMPAIDGNVLRVVARLDNDFTPITDPHYKKNLQQRFGALMPHKRAGDFNQALMELGALVCVPNGLPRCSICPLSDLCCAYQNGTAALLPIKAAKKPRSIEARTVLLTRFNEQICLRRRAKTGLLAGLWELPSLAGSLTPAQLCDALAALGWQVKQLLSLQPAKHIFTHIEWHMTGYYVELSEPPEALTLVSPAALREEYALPSAFRAFLQTIEEES